MVAAFLEVVDEGRAKAFSDVFFEMRHLLSGPMEVAVCPRREKWWAAACAMWQNV